MTPPDPISARRNTVVFFLAIFLILLAARLCHVDILWADEDYHQAVAIQILHGKIPYRDFWYDKPPLSAAGYLLFGAQGGWVLRLASAVFVTFVCWVAFLFAARVWSRREGYWAAGLFAVFLIFYFPGATLTLEPDTWIIAPHLLAVFYAWRGRAWVAGIFAGIAMLFNVKGLFVLGACLFFAWPSLALLAAGFILPNLIFLFGLWFSGALTGYIDQVWRWGLLYSGSPETVAAGLVRAVNWFGFHAVLAVGALCFFLRPKERSLQWGAWFVLSLIGAGIGWRFLPRYMDQLLPALVILTARSVSFQWQEKRRLLMAIVCLTLLIPVTRFGPRYAILAYELMTGSPDRWRDAALDADSQAAARIINGAKRPGDTIFVWGYRPNVVAYTRLPVAGKFWDSQPLTGVPADRHLSSSKPIAADWAKQNRAEVVRTKPTFIADGLSLLNPDLDIHKYPELSSWLDSYCDAGRTTQTIIYRRCRD
jgi:hypothetical protein